MCDHCQPRPQQVFPIITGGVLAGAMTVTPARCRDDCRCATCRPDIHVTGALPSPVVWLWPYTTTGAI
jgi:ferredoxin